MVLIHVQITGGFELKVKTSLLGEQLEHMIEEADAGRDVIPAAAFNLQFAGDLCFFRVALDGSGSHAVRASSSSLISSRTAFAPSEFSSKTSSSRRELVAAAMPMNGTPAAFALRASSTVSPTYHSSAPAESLPMCNKPSGAGLCFATATSSAPTIGSKRRCGAKRRSVSSASHR